MAISRTKRIAIFMGSFVVTSILMVSIFWDGDWLPGNQVKRTLLENKTQPLQVTQLAECQLNCLGLNITDARRFIEFGDVDLPPFEREPCKKYLISYEREGTDEVYEVIVKWCIEEIASTRDGQQGTAILEPVFLEEVRKIGQDCSCK